MPRNHLSQGRAAAKAAKKSKPNGLAHLVAPQPICSNGGSPLGVVRGVIPFHQEKQQPKRFTWKVERGAAKNYRLLGQRLAATGGLYRHQTDGLGLIQVLPSGQTRTITTGGHLAPLIADRVPMRVLRAGRVVSELPTAAHLAAMLRSEQFLGQFLPVDEVARTPSCLDDFSLVSPGYNDGGPDRRILYLGPIATAVQSTETIEKFLDVMPFASEADRTNTVAAGLTLHLRRLWPGEKPLVVITATKSHSGKGTLTEFFRGCTSQLDILYECIDWPMQVQFQKQIRTTPDAGLIVFDNVRLDSSGPRARVIRSAFLESFLTTPQVILASPGGGEPVQFVNKFVVTLNTNDGMLSADLLNRSLPIHLAPQGDLYDHPCPIGNPRLEFLPANRDRIESEFRGMIQRWKEAGSPLDDAVRHPMLRWAKVVGGILRTNGFADFLANYGNRTSTNDPIREALAILGTIKPDQPLRPREWADVAVEQGLGKTVFPPNERDTPAGRERSIGVLLKRHLGSILHGETEKTRYRLRLEGGFRRWTPGKNPYTCYRFQILDQQSIPVDGERTI